MPDEVRNQTNNQSLIAEIQNRIQFLVMIAIFFSAIIYYFFNIYDKTNANEVALSYAGFVAAYLLTYICFEILKNKIKTIFLKVINILILIGVGTFLLPIIYLNLIATQPSMLLFIMQILFKISLYGLIIVPLLLLTIILGPFIFWQRKQNKRSKN